MFKSYNKLLYNVIKLYEKQKETQKQLEEKKNYQKEEEQPKFNPDTSTLPTYLHL